jgi:hypothetical protein
VYEENRRLNWECLTCHIVKQHERREFWPIRVAIQQSRQIRRSRRIVNRRDGKFTTGDPLELHEQLQRKKRIATEIEEIVILMNVAAL